MKQSSATSADAEEDPDRVYHSDSAVDSNAEVNMPVGTSFENSAMKSSFSLSSLQSAGGGSGGEAGHPGCGAAGGVFKAPAPPERPYHSLTKKRKDPNREVWRRSWGSTHSTQSSHSLGSSNTLTAKDDFWAALQHNYNYIMDNQLIDSCKEASGELSAEATPPTSLTLPEELPSSCSQWGLAQLIKDFTEICQWLTSMQEEVYATPESLANRTLRATRMAELLAASARRRRFLEQAAGALARGGPAAKAEVAWRARHLALKWDSVQQAMSPEQDASNGNADTEHEVKCLRRWVREMESRLPQLTLNVAAGWSRLELQQKVQEHQVLQREVEWHGRIVSSVVRLCRPGPAEPLARGLERRWHLLYLRALEWQCHLESCQTRIENQGPPHPPPAPDSDEEPVLKQRRLQGPEQGAADYLTQGDQGERFQEYVTNSSSEESYSEDDVDDDRHCSGLAQDSYSFKGTSTGSEADTEGSMADEESDIIMASLRDCDNGNINSMLITEMPHLELSPKSKMAALNQDQVVGDQCDGLDCIDGADPDSPLQASMYDDDQSAPVTVIKRPKKRSDISKFNKSNRKSKNCATFYFKHHDTDSDRQMISGASGTEEKSQEETSEDEWTFTACDNKEASEDNTDVMTSSCEQQSELQLDSDVTNEKEKARMKLDFGNAQNMNPNEQRNETNLIPKVDDKRSNESHETKNGKQSEHVLPQILINKESIQRLVNQAEEMVQKRAQQMNCVPKELAKSMSKKSKVARNFKPLSFGDNAKGVHSQNKMSRIKEWLQQHTGDGQSTDSQQQVLDSCDASGEYTTGDSEPDRLSVTSEELSPSVATYRNVMSSQEHSINAATPTNHSTPEHNKVTLRGKRSNSQSTRPWSVSCLSQLNYVTKDVTTTSGSTLNTPTADDADLAAVYGRTSGMSISESALNMLATTSPGIGRCSQKNGNYKFQGSTSSVKTTLQGNISSSTTINEGCINCHDNTAESKQCAIRRKRLKLRRRNQGMPSNELEAEELRLAQILSSKRGNRLVKSCSFSGRSSMVPKEAERCTASDPSSSRKHIFDTTSTSGNDSEEDLLKLPILTLPMARSNDRTLHASTSEDQDNPCESVCQTSSDMTPVFKLGPESGLVRPRISLLNMEIQRRPSLLEQTILERGVFVELGLDRDSDVDRSIQTAGTEEHSSFSEQAWDFYQEKYNSEPYSEAPDSDAARRLLEFGDDYRAYLDSQSDCCSSLSAHPEHEPSPLSRRRTRPNYSPTESQRKPSKNPQDSPEYGSFGRRSKKSSTSSFDRKKTLMDSLERAKRSPGTDSLERIRRAKKVASDSLDRKNSKNSSISDCDLLQTRRRHTSSNSTQSDANNSSLEYQPYLNIGNKPDILDSLKRTRKPSSEMIDSPRRFHDSSVNSHSLDSPMRRKRFSQNQLDDSSDGANDSRVYGHSLPRRRASAGVNLSQLSGANGDDRGSLDSDSDIDDVQHLIERSHSQLEATEAVLSKDESAPDLLQPNDYSEIVATCCENVRCLEVLLNGAARGDTSVLSATQLRDIRGLVTRWSGARACGEARACARRLHRELLALRGNVQAGRPQDQQQSRPQLHTRGQLQQRLDQLKNRLATLQEQKTVMLKLNVSVHRLITDVGRTTSSSTGSSLTDTLCQNLKDEVSDVYRLWEESHESTSSEMTTLEGALGAWGAWERGLAELRGALRGDSDQLRLIEAALAAGDPARVAPHVTHVARLLSETTHQKGECGSLSDSGISDSGSEQELSERERRLSGLRAAARAMEAVLAPGSKLLKAMAKRMEQTELELRLLQTACRELIVRTAGGVAGGNQLEKLNTQARVPYMSELSSNGHSAACGTGDPDRDPPGPVSWLRRWPWCSLPLQLCLLALVFACLLGGPRCCDAVNNLGILPHLRYLKGPPPM